MNDRLDRKYAVFADPDTDTDAAAGPVSAPYLDEIEDEAYRRSSLHGDARIEADCALPVRTAVMQRLRESADSGEVGAYSRSDSAKSSQTLSLSGIWRMKSCDPADPGDPAPFTGWFGRKGRQSPGMAEKWYAPGFDRSDWDEVTVPSTVQKSLVKLGKLPDPYWDTNTIDELEQHGEPKQFPAWFRRTRIERQDWWFAKTFELPEKWRGRRLTLRFGGLDYSGTVFLNGQSLGHHAGMFGGPDLDVSRLARFESEGVNELVVRIDQAPQSWNGKLKGSPGFGWHYGHLISLGIWRDVTVTAEPDVSVLEPYAVTQSLGASSAQLRIEYALDSLLREQTTVSVELEIRRKADTPQSAAASADQKKREEEARRNRETKPDAPQPDGNFDGSNVFRFRTEAEIGYGRTRFAAEIDLPDPALWWPAGYGDPNLYTLSLSVYDGGAQAEAAERRALHAAETVFGVRTLHMRPAPKAEPGKHYRWQFVVNGIPMFIKGANWCWPEPMLEQNERLYARLLELARRGGVQMLRAWGGGLVESDFFYELCDQKGILVYQEFPLCWGPPDSPHTDLGVLDRQVSRSVTRLRSHPSLVMWGGGNENGVHGGADEGLFLVGRRCRGLDPSRPFHRTDPWGGSVHNWDVYHGGEPLERSTLGMPSVFYGEYGIPSQPDRESCLRYMPAEELDAFPPTEKSRGWKAHFHQFGLKDIIKVMRYGAYGPIRSWDDYALYSQSAQGNSIAFTGDAQRAGSGLGKTGFWYYKFSELFPGHSWGVVDFYGTPKLSYYRARQTCLPRSAFAVYPRAEGWSAGETLDVSLHVANDARDALSNASATVILYGASLQTAYSRTFGKFELAAGETVKLPYEPIVLPREAAESSPFLLAVSLRDENGTLLSDRWYAFNGQPKTEELLAFEHQHRGDANEYPGAEAERAFELYGGLPDAPLRRLPQTRLEWTVRQNERGGAIVVRNIGDLPAYRVIAEGFPSGWEWFLADNDFGLYPGEERVIGFEGEGSGLPEQVMIGAWNAPKVGAGRRSVAESS
ncbi:glycoside hydrolase family 2 protein [Saccharibacillus sacchari]|uniref:Sugar-binding domain-containing protein n=1 Tax=Saccharibacillus sacchari TaxID=456493 RepID=A0ACC6PH83_9BACL